jgi:hypothetical protein
MPEPSRPDAGSAASGAGDAAAEAHGVEAVATGIHRAERDAELAAEGWSRRFVGAPPKLKEHVELYESLGQEVLQDAVSEEELAEVCAGCALALTFFKVVYTRSAK